MLFPEKLIPILSWKSKKGENRSKARRHSHSNSHIGTKITKVDTHIQTLVLHSSPWYMKIITILVKSQILSSSQKRKSNAIIIIWKTYISIYLHVEIRNSNNVEKIKIIFPSIHLQKQFQIMISNITYNPDRNISCQTNLFIPLHGCFQRIHCMHSLWYILCWCPNTKCNITPWTCGKDIIPTYKLPCH